MIDPNDIIYAINEEIRATPDHVDFGVESKVRDGSLWKVFISPNAAGRNELDESLEGARVWWKGEPPGTAEVLSVVPDESQINLRYATKEPPARGEKIRIYLPKYLEKLVTVWEDDPWADLCLRWLDRIETSSVADENRRLQSGAFPWLRKAQRQAFALPRFAASFLHGPPGTGKTRTLGAMIAQHVVQFPNERVLLLSTTNVAVDEALVAADKALAELPGSNVERIRFDQCKRAGNHFVASRYAARDHLLPKQDPALLQELIRLEAKRPREEDVQAYAAWKQRTEQIRSQMKANAVAVLKESRLIAMTTTRAVYTFDSVRESYPTSLIVFDESSQVGLAHALALAPLGRRSLFTGDPFQLAPIARSDSTAAREWLGRSMFAVRPGSDDAKCLLNEQSRMAEPICQVVSKTFYQGRLRVAADCKQEWLRKRDLDSYRTMKQHVNIHSVSGDHNYSQKYGGWIRFESAELTAHLVETLYEEADSDILVLTPFRAQRRLIRTFLKNKGLRGVRVSTVHRAQGSECHTVIFDPVNGSNDFLNNDDDAPRLINVALSRAMARLVVLLSPDDLKNPILARINSIVKNLAGITQAGEGRIDKKQRQRHISLVLSDGFPSNAINKEISIHSQKGPIVGKVREVLSNGAEFTLFVYATGETKKFKTEFVRKNAQTP